MTSFKNWLGLGKKSVISIDTLNEQTREGINKAYIPKFLYKPPFGYPRFANMPYIRYLAQTPYVEMCIKTIVDEIAAIEWDIITTKGMEDQENEVEKEHIRNFFLNPNTNNESFEDVFIQMPVRDILEVNAGVLNKVFNMKEELVEVVARDGATFTKNPDMHGMFTNRDDIVNPTNIVKDNMNQEYFNSYSDITDSDVREKAAYFQYGWIAGPVPVPFGKREIIWLEKMKRTDDHYGFSPVQTLAKSLQMLMYMIESDLEYFNENNVPKGIIGLDQSDSEEIKAFKEQWFETQQTKDEFGSWKKMMHKVPIVNKVPTFTRIEFSSSEMQIIEKQKWYTKMVWSCFGVTPVELGYTDDAKGSANQIVQSKVFRKKAINPMLRNLEAKFNSNIISEFNYWGEIKTEDGKIIRKPKYEFVFKKFDVDEEKSKYELYKIQVETGVRTINEIRKDEGMDPLAWGDDQPGAMPEGEEYTGYDDENNDGEYVDPDAEPDDYEQDDVDEYSEKKKENKSFELKYKYIKRTGTPGHYKYWYKDPKTGKLTEGKKPKTDDKYIIEANNILKKLPKEYSKYLSGKVKRTNSNVAAQVNTETGDMFIGPKWDKSSTSDKIDLVYHELSHRIMKEKINKFNNPIIEKNYTEGFKEEPKFDKDPVEDFTDSIAAFIQPRYNKNLKITAPKKYRAIKEFLKSIQPTSIKSISYKKLRGPPEKPTEDPDAEPEEEEDDKKDPKKKKEEVDIKHKYIKRTGSTGNYKYWYGEENSGKLIQGFKPTKKKIAEGIIEDSEENSTDKKQELNLIKEVEKHKSYEDFIEHFKEGQSGIHSLDFISKEVPLKNIKPSQTGDDYINDTSRGYARGDVVENYGTSKEKPTNLGPLKDPNKLPAIIIDKNNKIIDGNHRHAAAKLAGLDKVKVVNEEQLKEFYKKNKKNSSEKKAQQLSNPLILKEGERPTGYEKLESGIKYLNKQNEQEIMKLLAAEMDKGKIQETKGLNDIIEQIKYFIDIKVIEEFTKEIIKNNYMLGWDQAEADLDLNIIPDKNAIEYMGNYTYDLVKDMNDDIADKLRGVMQRAFMAGSTIEEIKPEISKVFDVGNNRTEMIARTESNRAANFGRLHGYMKSGMPGKKVYSAHLDGRTSPLCKRLHGQEVELKDDFVDPKGTWKGPVPPAHVNCRSSWTFKSEINSD